MSLRHIVYGLLIAKAEVVVAVANRIYDAGALGTPTGKEIPAKPFIVINHGPNQATPTEDQRIEDRLTDIYVYGDPGDFTAVERLIAHVRAALQNAESFYVDPENSDRKTWLTSCKFMGSSSDLYDDTYRANCRYETYRLVGNTP